MERLKRTPDLSEIKTFELADGTKIKVRRVKAGALLQNANARNMSDVERGWRVMAAKMLVCLPGETDFKEIFYEDLIECFNDEELNIISSNIVDEDAVKNA